MFTNRDLPGDGVIWEYGAPCGKSTEAHAVMTDDLAGDALPSGRITRPGGLAQGLLVVAG